MIFHSSHLICLSRTGMVQDAAGVPQGISSDDAYKPGEIDAAAALPLWMAADRCARMAKHRHGKR
jgi:hypothetical protein